MIPSTLPLGNPEALAYVEAVERLGAATAAPPMATVTHGDDPAQAADVYAPPGRDNARAPLPILVFFHGGSWIQGSRSWLRFMAPAVWEAGAILVAGSYRLAPGHKWPAQIEDVRATLALVAQTAPSFGGDPAAMVIGGHSAGGHLAALAALTLDRPPLLACFPVSGPMDLRYGDIPMESPKARAYRYLLQTRDQDAAASPAAFVNPDAPPFHLMWGENDFEHVASSNPLLATALADAGVGVTTRILPGAGHFDTHLALGGAGADWYGALRRVWRR